MPTKLSGSTRGRTGMRRRSGVPRDVRVNLVHLPPRRPRWARREAPVILTVDAAAMHAAGHAFYQAANGVWLTDHLPPGALSGWPG
jgi:putative RNA 2'-phosphotransferase